MITHFTDTHTFKYIDSIFNKTTLNKSTIKSAEGDAGDAGDVKGGKGDESHTPTQFNLFDYNKALAKDVEVFYTTLINKCAV